MSDLRTTPRTTLWEEGRHSGRLVRTAAVTVILAAALVDVLIFSTLSYLFDLVFIAVCVAAALAVRPRDFFVVGVLPPLMMLGTVLLLALTARGVIAEPGDVLLQAVVSGLAHHAGALVVGYVLCLALLAVRQVAVRNAGVLRNGARPS